MGGIAFRDDSREVDRTRARPDTGETARQAATDTGAAPRPTPEVAAILNALDPFWTRSIAPAPQGDSDAPHQGDP